MEILTFDCFESGLESFLVYRVSCGVDLGEVVSGGHEIGGVHGNVLGDVRAREKVDRLMPFSEEMVIL